MNLVNIYGGDLALAGEVDLWLNLAFAATIIGFHVFCVVGAVSGHFHISWEKVYANNAPVAAKFADRKKTAEQSMITDRLWYSESRRPVSVHEIFGGAFNCKKAKRIREHIVSEFTTEPTDYKADDFMGQPTGGTVSVNVEL